MAPAPASGPTIHPTQPTQPPARRVVVCRVVLYEDQGSNRHPPRLRATKASGIAAGPRRPRTIAIPLIFSATFSMTDIIPFVPNVLHLDLSRIWPILILVVWHGLPRFSWSRSNGGRSHTAPLAGPELAPKPCS